MRRKRNKKAGWDFLSAIIIAFGLGLFLALFGSLRLVLFITITALIWIGIQSRC